MIRDFWIIGIVCFLFIGGVSCHSKQVPLNEEEFVSLLMDMHRVDGILATNREFGSESMEENYAYYNGLFKKYGITRADFDTCMYHYSAQTKLMDKMYDDVIDRLNKQLTEIDRLLNELKANDSVNYFPLHDTLHLDRVYTVVVDSIEPGLYHFSTTLQFDKAIADRLRCIHSFFLTDDNKDTLVVKDVLVIPDSNKRTYAWKQYADSLYSKLVIRYMEIIPWERRAREYKNGKWIEPNKNEKIYDLKNLGGRAWENKLYRPYISKREEERLKGVLSYQRLKKNE